MSTRSSQVARHNAAQRPHLRVVRKKSRGLIKRSRASRMAPTLIIAAIVAITLVFGVLLEQIVLAQSAFRLSAIRERLVVAEEKYEKLMHEAVLLDNPSRIERIATERLGMIEPDPGSQKFVVARLRMNDGGAALAGLRHEALSTEGAAAAGASDGISP